MAITPVAQSPVERALTIPPPVLGWNTRDAKSEMDLQYALDLVNFFPVSGGVELRKGHTIYCQTSFNPVGLGTLKYGSVDALICSEFLSSPTNNQVSNITTGSAVNISGGVDTAAPFIFFQQFRDRLFMTTGGGTDDVYHYTGSGNITASAFTGPGGDDKLLGPMAAFKNRLYFAYRTTTTTGLPEIWYGGVDAITGALTQFSVLSALRLGGYIAFIGSVTRAKDFSEDELFAIVSSEGEILLYEGAYPGDWSLRGRYFVPKPVGPRAFFYYGADLMIITRQGVVPMSAVMGNPADASVSSDITNIIKSAFTEAVTDSLVGDLRWMGINYPKGNYLLINIPTASTTADQFVMNTITGAWCRFTGQNAYAWGLWQENLYFTYRNSDTKVFRADNGFFDENPAIPAAAVARTLKLRHAFNYLGTPTKRKKFTAATPTVYQSENLSITLNCDVDYTDTTATSTETDTSKGTSYQIYQPKCGLVAESGNAVSIRIEGTASTKRFRLEATKVFWNDGQDF